MTAGGDEQGRCRRRPGLGLRMKLLHGHGFIAYLPLPSPIPTPPAHIHIAQDVTFYKMFGYPTGLGALLVRTDAVTPLRKGERWKCDSSVTPLRKGETGRHGY